jgi:hypothetical protein
MEDFSKQMSWSRILCCVLGRVKNLGCAAQSYLEEVRVMPTFCGC